MCTYKGCLTSPTTSNPPPPATRNVPLSHPGPEAMSLLHQRLLLAEEEAEALIQDMGALGVPRDQILGSAQRIYATQHPVSPLKMRWVLGDEGILWQQCDSLVSRVCRMESLLQTLKLTIFRLETERELDPSHTAHLKQQLAELQQESQEEYQASRREVMKLRDRLQQAYQERDEARTEVQMLGETVEIATAAKMDVALAAKELKIVKLEMSQKLIEMKEQMRQESARSDEAMISHSELLQRVEEMERVVEMERRQALLLRSDCQVLQVQVQTSRQQLEEEKDRGRQLEEHCQELKEQTAMKDSLVAELKTELKAERSRVVKQLQERDLQLEAARRNIQTELHVALTDKVSLQLELEKLEGEHAQLVQRSSIAQETAVTQREQLERTIERLRGELSTAKKEEAAMRKDLEGSKHELCLVVTKLEGERSSLESQLSEAKQEMVSLSSALQSQQVENRRLMGHKISELEALQGVCGSAGAVASQTLESILASNTSLQLNSRNLQQKLGGREQELATLKTDRLQAQREIRKHQEEVEKLQRLLTSTHSKNNKAKALDTAKVDNKRLALSLEQAVLINSSLHSKLEQARDQHQATITLRDEELREARTKISHLSEELGTIKQQTKEDYESSMKTLHREISELKMTVKDSSNGSSHLSRANQELRRRVSELEWLVSKQKACIRQQQDNSQKVEVLRKREAEWERWTSTIQRWEDKRELAHIAAGSKPVRTRLTTQSH
ncbi:coiled-coil domain-containing protein 150 isoform X1 [Sander lucioperca]|uniref:coiled-coil domain-containing protein 150 isoform X1 n=2 Tax=Sander lucioperca TaxID=283035 RepID=UPI00125D6EE4|nr:coiled-coil domain-containing protein 150 isoform X1 [Sander lucioperca]